MIRCVKFVSIPVRDQEAALEFYTTKLGFSIVTDQPFGAQRWIELRPAKGETRVVLFTSEGEEKRIGTFMNLSFECDNVDKTYEELRAKGVEFEKPPTKQHWGNFAILKDQDGNKLLISSGGG
jgi:catechol 2,3-dioxygenase-like lactoylglutathione lyase family enzyme